MNNMYDVFKYVLPYVIVAIALYLSFWTKILRDQSNAEKKPYSFARAQLMWWTTIIVSHYAAYFGHIKKLGELPTSCLTLLGISVAAATAARIIDGRDIAENVVRHQDQTLGVNFFRNILSDENGISVHRFQAVVFNIIFGLVFMAVFHQERGFVDFSATELALMGISSAAYLGVKINENKG